MIEVATHNPLDSSKNTGHSEFGGGPGPYQRLADGHGLSVKERRRFITAEAVHSAGVMEDLPETDEHYDAVPALRAWRRDHYGDHTLDEALGG